MTPTTRYAKSGDVCIAYQVTGDGPIDLILAPGTVSHLDLDWEIPIRADFFRRLSSMFRLIRFDKRGTGLSDRPTEMATLEQRADDIRAVMDAVGHCIRRHPGCVGRRVDGGDVRGHLSGAHARAAHLGRDGALGRKRRSSVGTKSRGERRDDPRCAGELAVGMVHPRARRGLMVRMRTTPLVQSAIRYCRAAANPSAAAAYERMNSEIDIRSILPAIKVPTLVMNRTGDPVAPCEGARDMAKRIPGARFVEFPGNTHSMMAIAPEKVLAEIQEFVTGVRPVEVDDRVLATVLFVDVANSTQALSELGDSAWKTRLEGYYRIVRNELARYRGRETNTAGDGIMASFDGPGRAVRCALAIASNVKPLGLEVRAGLHTGEVELMGDNIGGIAVHLASRVQSEAGAGEVMVSSTTKDLVAGAGLKFDPRGSRPLKGVPGEWALFAATA